VNLRENWRVALLVVFVVAAAVAIFAPFAAPGSSANASLATSGGPTNLQYGLQLAGGTRIQAPLVGTTAEGVDVSQDQASEIRATVASELGVTESDVNVRPRRPGGGAVEVLVENVSQSEFENALSSAGLDPDADGVTVRNGVTEQTRSETVETINAKINRGGLSGGTASVTTGATGQNFVVIEVPNANRSRVLDLVGDRGVVEIVAHHPVETEDGTEWANTTVLTNDQLQRAQVGVADTGRNGQPGVPVTLSEQDAEEYSTLLQETGFTSQEAVSGQACRYYENREDPGYCLYTVLDSDIVFAASLTEGLAADIQSGAFTQNPTFRMTTRSLADAQELQIDLRAGALPARLAIEEGTVYFLQPSLAQQFKFQALLAGLIAWFAVSGAVFLRYRSERVAVPMLLTAAAEVFLLLGFAALVGLALDLSHIAGFIAVIGTGVDDLIIIADEILQEGEVATGRVFQNRFRKAFWVIGAAAATTIIAMSPLTVISLGDLTGFAIVTIVGVLLGVLVTRPAYGDVLRTLMLSEEN